MGKLLWPLPTVVAVHRITASDVLVRSVDTRWFARRCAHDLGCTALMAPEQAFTLANVGGAANWSLAIPFLPAFAGLHFYLQGGVLVLGFNPGGFVFTRALAGMVGR